MIRRLTAIKIFFADTNAVDKLSYFSLKMAVDKY